MKALVLSVVIAMTSVVNAVSGNKVNEFAYNSKENNLEQVESQTVFKVENQKFLQNHLQYNFIYDNKGRVSKKEVMKWNEIMQVFEKQYCLNFNYTGEEVSIEYATWNKNEKAYSDIKEKAIYQTSENNLRYLGYEWNSKESKWNLVTEHDASQFSDILLANK